VEIDEGFARGEFECFDPGQQATLSLLHIGRDSDEPFEQPR